MIGSYVVPPAHLGTFQSYSIPLGESLHIRIPHGCALRLFDPTDPTGYNDYLHDFYYNSSFNTDCRPNRFPSPGMATTSLIASTTPEDDVAPNGDVAASMGDPIPDIDSEVDLTAEEYKSGKLVAQAASSPEPDSVTAAAADEDGMVYAAQTSGCVICTDNADSQCQRDGFERARVSTRDGSCGNGFHPHHNSRVGPRHRCEQACGVFNARCRFECLHFRPPSPPPPPSPSPPPPSPPGSSVVGYALYGYDPSRDPRVLLMDQHAEVSGDIQNSCRGRLLEPGKHNSLRLQGATSHSLRVLGGSRATYYQMDGFLGAQRNYRQGRHPNIHDSASPESTFSLEVHGPGQSSSLRVDTRWELMGTVDKGNTGPAWPTVSQGVEIYDTVSTLEATERANAVESAFSWEAQVGAQAAYDSPIFGIGFEVSAGITASSTTSRGSSTATANSFTAAITTSRTQTRTCPLTCPVPYQVAAPTSADGPDGGGGGTGTPEENERCRRQRGGGGSGGGGAATAATTSFVPDPVGRDCPAGSPGGKLFIWRWMGTLSEIRLEAEGQSTMALNTCHTQCTCGPTPPACAFSDCVDQFCTICKDNGPQPIAPTQAE